MKDEEKAEEYTFNYGCKKWCTDNVCDDVSEDCDTAMTMKQAYLDCLAEGRSKWHDLRKDPNDWPKENSKYIVHIKVSEIRTITDTGF